MSTRRSALPILALTPDDIESLPAAFREKIKASLVGTMQSPVKWMMLIAASSAAEAATMTKTVRTVAKIAAERRKAITEKNIESLLDLYLEGEQRAEVDEELERDNAELRADYIKNTECYSAMQIRLLLNQNAPKNPSEPASRWKREKRIFALSHGNSDLFPAFQFSDGAPLASMKKVLAALPKNLTPWQIAFWFASGNGWLNGATPELSLADGNSVIEAAMRLEAIAVG